MVELKPTEFERLLEGSSLQLGDSDMSLDEVLSRGRVSISKCVKFKTITPMYGELGVSESSIEAQSGKYLTERGRERHVLQIWFDQDYSDLNETLKYRLKLLKGLAKRLSPKLALSINYTGATIEPRISKSANVVFRPRGKFSIRCEYSNNPVHWREEPQRDLATVYSFLQRVHPLDVGIEQNAKEFLELYDKESQIPFEERVRIYMERKGEDPSLTLLYTATVPEEVRFANSQLLTYERNPSRIRVFIDLESVSY